MIPAEITIQTKSIAMIALSPLGALSIGVLATLVVRGWPTDSAAAWIQAVGSVAAIIAAWWMSQEQRRHDSFFRSEADAVDERQRRIQHARQELAMANEVFFLVAEFDFLLDRIDIFIKSDYDIELGQWGVNIRELLSQIKYNATDTSEPRGFLRFELRQNVLDIMGFLDAPRTPTWKAAFVKGWAHCREETNDLQRRGNVELEARNLDLWKLENTE